MVEILSCGVLEKDLVKDCCKGDLLHNESSQLETVMFVTLERSFSCVSYSGICHSCIVSEALPSYAQQKEYDSDDFHSNSLFLNFDTSNSEGFQDEICFFLISKTIILTFSRRLSFFSSYPLYSLSKVSSYPSFALVYIYVYL